MTNFQARWNSAINRILDSDLLAKIKHLLADLIFPTLLVSAILALTIFFTFTLLAHFPSSTNTLTLTIQSCQPQK